MANTTQTDSANTPLAFGISGLAANSTFTSGWSSAEVENTQGYVDVLVTVLPITSGATVAVGQYIGLWAAGQNTSFVTNPITAAGGIDGVDSAAVLTNTSTLNSLRFVAAPTATATGALPYVIEPFSMAQLFGGVMPKFWCLYLAHNHGSALGTNTNRFSFNGITYTTA
jgi:hypothetical protein